MVTENSQEPILAEAVIPGLQVNWESIQAKRSDLVAFLNEMAANMPSEGRKRIDSLSSWFAKPRKFEEALIRTDVLAVCVPLSKSLDDQGELRKFDIATAARVGFCSISQNSSGNKQLLKALAYPAIALLGVAVVAIFFSFSVTPQFEEMFKEFGIELPYATVFFFEVAQAIRNWCWFLIVWLVAAIGLALFLNGVSARRRPDGQGWLDLWMQSSRMALADWAWHISLLLEAGLSQSNAMQKAGRFAGKSWLRQNSSFWADRKPKESTGGNVLLEPGILARRYLHSPKYQLLDFALAIPNSEGKIHLLREVAGYYRDRNRSISLWWIEWLIAFLLWGTGAVIVCFIIALFAPLFAIVSGLTGN